MPAAEGGADRARERALAALSSPWRRDDGPPPTHRRPAPHGARVRVNVWTGAPLAALWIGARLQGDTTAVKMSSRLRRDRLPRDVFAALLVQAMTRLSAKYDELSNIVQPRRQAPWMRSMRGDRPEELIAAQDAPRRRRSSSARCWLAILCFEVWFFFFSGSSIGGGRRALMSVPTRELPARYEPATPSRGSSRAGRRRGSSIPSRRATAAENYSIAIPPPNVTGALHMGHALNGSVQDTLDPLPPDARAAREVDPRHRPRRHRHPDAGREAARAPRARAARRSAARRSSSACGSGARSTAARSSSSSSGSGASLRLRRRALHARRGLRRGRAEGLRRPLRQGPDLPRQLHGQLGPGPRSAISDLEVEEREVTDTLYYVDYPLESGSGSHHGRDGAAGDDARRHRDRGAPRRRALHAAGRRDGDPAARRAAAEDHRRPLRQAGVRHGRAEDHAGPRPQRLRDRPQPRARGDLGRSARTAA